jgi:hypothetical protein
MDISNDQIVSPLPNVSPTIASPDPHASSVQPQETLNDTKKPFPIFKILLSLIVGVLVVVTGGMWVYNKYYALSYNDSKYGFIIKSQRDWYSVSQKEGVYYSLGTSTSSSGNVISYFGVAPRKHVSSNTQYDTETFKKSCNDNAQEMKFNLVNISSITLNNLQGYFCTFEGKAINVDKIYVLKQYLLLNKNGGKYEYLISASYPKGDALEEEKVTRIINNFYAK